MLFTNNWSKAIENSIYYADINNFTNPVKTFQYSDKESFYNIIKDLHNNIEVVATFGGKDSICYKIFNSLDYNSLLFDKTTSIYFVNRKGMYICLEREIDVNEMTSIKTEMNINENQRIGVLKIDAVLSEYKENNLKNYLYYPVTFGLGIGIGGLITYFGLKHINE